MPRHGRNYNTAKAAIEARPYPVAEAVSLVKQGAYADFDESVEVAMKLGVDPRHADQMVRGSVVLPHGTGQEMRVLVITQGEKVKEAEEAGADFVGGSDMVEKIEEGWLDFDAVVATPDMMREVGKLGRILGPRGLMPNPKSGTVTFDVGDAVTEIKAGKLDFRVDKNGVVHAAVGKVSFEEAELMDNANALFDAVLHQRPASAKGRYVRSVYLSSTMGPSVQVDAAEIVPK